MLIDNCIRDIEVSQETDTWEGISIREIRTFKGAYYYDYFGGRTTKRWNMMLRKDINNKGRHIRNIRLTKLREAFFIGQAKHKVYK